MLDKVIEVGLLIDFYGKLLTEKQREAMILYYYDDLSLGEIAERLDISRQGVYDHLHRGEDILRDYEHKLKLVSKYNKLKKMLNDTDKIIKKKVYNKSVKKEIRKKIKEIKEEL